MVPLPPIQSILRLYGWCCQCIVIALLSFSYAHAEPVVAPSTPEPPKSTATVRILDPLTPQDSTQPVRTEDFTDTATFQGLDKITAHVSPLILTVGHTNYFGNLEITLHSCWRAPTDEEPESKAFVDIFEHVPGEKNKQRFHGWMFASSPALSALEHPVYDITLISCTSSKDAPPAAIIPSQILQKPLEIDNLQDLD